MTKRVISMVLAVMMLLPCVPAMAKDDTVIFLNNVYEDYITNSKPADMTVEGEADIIVCDKTDSDKCILVNKRADKASRFFQNINAVGNCVVSLDMKMDSVRSKTAIAFGTGGREYVPITIESNGEMKTASGRTISTFPVDTWVNIAVAYNYDRQYIDFYINNRCVLGEWRPELVGLGDVEYLRVDFSPSSEDSKIYVDNIRAYSGTKLKKDSYFPKVAYNQATVEYVEGIYEPGDAIINKFDFTQRAAGNITPKSNKIEWTQEELETGELNGYLHWECFGVDDPILDFTQSSDSPYLVYQADIRYDSITAPIELFDLKLKPDSAMCQFAYVRPGGQVSIRNGLSEQQVGNIKPGKWYTIAVAVNFLSKSFDCYLDGVKVAQNAQMMLTDKNNPNLLRFVAKPGKGKFDLDNIFVYEGKEPREISVGTSKPGEAVDLEMVSNSWTSESKSKSYLQGTLAFHGGSGAVFVDDEKTYPENAPFIENKTTYLPLRFTAEKLGHNVTWDEAENVAICDGVKLHLGADIVTINGNEIKLSGPIISKDGSLFVPADIFGVDRLCNVINYSSWSGLVVLRGKVKYPSADEWEMTSYMMNKRPKAEELKNDFFNNHRADVHPRVLATEDDFARVRELIKTDKNAKKMFDNIKEQANKYMKEPLQYYHLSDGVRLLSVSGAVRNLALYAGFVYRVTGEKEYAERLAQELVNVAENFEDWHPIHYLDTGEMAFGMGLGYDWIYDYLSEEQRKTIAQGMKQCGIDVYLEQYIQQAGWTRSDSNWGFICNGGGVAMAVALADEYPDECFAIVESAIRSSDYPFSRYAPDGGWYEGPGYWGYSMMYLCYLVASVESGFGTDYGMLKNTGVNNTMNYLLSITGANQRAFCYSDADSPNEKRADYGVWLGHEFNQPSWVKMRTDLAQVTTEVNDLLYYRTEEYEAGKEINLPLDSYFRDVEVASHRSSWTDNNMLWVGYKGGFANQSHGHYDNGSFEFDLNGVRWAKDLGKDDYNISDYKNCYRKLTEGHNTLLINPETNKGEQQDGNGVGRIVDFKSGESSSYGVLDLSEPYNQFAQSVKRGFKVDDFRNSLTIRDEIEIKGSNNTIYWFMHTGIEDESNIQINGKTAVLTDPTSGEQLYFEYNTNVPSEFKIMKSEPLPSSPNSDGQAENPGKKLAIVLKGGGSINITVKMSDKKLKDSGLIKEMDTSAISKWTVDNTPMPKKPEATAIYANGNAIEDFSLEKTDYKYVCNFTDPDPIFSCDANDEYELVTEKYDNITTITLINKANPIMRTKYKVTVRKIPDILENLDGYTRLMPKSVTASRVPQAENPPENVLDGSVDTRYAVDGDNEWIQLDMGEVVEIDGYAISYYMGTVRDSFYDILISEDGKNYTTVFEGQTSGLTDNYELFKSQLKFRYFKLVGHCNTKGVWNSPTEIAFLKNNN